MTSKLPFGEKAGQGKRSRRQIVFNTGAVKGYPDESLQAMYAIAHGRASESFRLTATKDKKILSTHVIDLNDPETAKSFIEKHGTPAEGEKSKSLRFLSARFVLLPSPVRYHGKDNLDTDNIELDNGVTIYPTISGVVQSDIVQRLAQPLVIARQIEVEPVQNIQGAANHFKIRIQQAEPLGLTHVKKSDIKLPKPDSISKGP